MPAEPLSLPDWLARLLDHPRLHWIAALSAVVLSLPALAGGLAADDWFHRAQTDPTFTRVPHTRSPILDMFAFFSPDAAVRHEQTVAGVLPWWTQSDVRGAFFRPLAALTHLFDWRIVGDHPVWHHAQSLGWLAASVLAVGALMRTWLGGRVGALATLLFAVDDAHAWPAAWIANRNALMAMTFGALAARSYLLGARGNRRARWLSPLFIALTLCSAEAGSAAILMIGVLESGLEGSVRGRLARLAPLAMVVMAWAVTWRTLGYGIHGSGLYVDPVGAPLRFLAGVPERVGALSAALWLNVPVDFWVLLPSRMALPLGLALGAWAAGFVAFVAAEVVRSPRGREGLAIAVLCLIPACAAFPMERVCTFAGMGAAALLALATVECSRWRDRATLALHLPLSALMLTAKTIGMPALLGQLGAVADAIPSSREVAAQDVVMVSGLEITTAYIPVDRTYRGLSVPRHMLLLAPASTAVRTTRVDDTTLRLDLPNGSFHHAIERLCRDSPFSVGERVQTGVATVEVLTIDGHGHPTAIQATFDRSLDSPDLVWLAPEARALTLVPWAPPAMGEARDVPALLELPE